MRDPKRIDMFLQTLKWYWKRNPDLRFGQVVVNLLGIDPFYIEDDIALEKIKDAHNKLNDNHIPKMKDLKGIAPDITGNKLSEDFIKDLRSQWDD